jgi:hypothetical protein
MIKILKESIRGVPAMKYALAVAGLLSVVGLVSAFKISPPTAVFGVVIVLVLWPSLTAETGSLPTNHVRHQKQVNPSPALARHR